MVATFSPHRDAGATLQLHSPTHVRHMDALAEIRRSLSRSPSKNSDLRSFASRSNSPSSRNLPFSPSPLSPRRSVSDNLLQTSGNIVPSPLAIPFPPSAKIHRPATRRTLHSQSTPRLRTSPKSPSKKALLDSTSKGNVNPVPFLPRRSFEKDKASQDPQFAGDKENVSMQELEEPPKPVLKRRSGNFSMVAASSPLKRSDGIMNLDQASQGSPSAKRRSLHGASFGSDFNVFDLDNRGEDEGQGDNQSTTEDVELGPFSQGTVFSTQFSSIPRRSSSLRKSTLQQRQHDRPLLMRNRQPGDVSKRMSLDIHLTPSVRDSPFSPGILPNASIHLLGPQANSQHPRHPLSRTMTQSSSGSSLAEDSPTHEPIHKFDRPRPVLDFTKSLPIGSSRPSEMLQHGQSSQESSQGSFATPASYKFAKPLPAAFMSTGLISKRNRNVEEPHGGLPKSHMPDTPCKRASLHLTDATETNTERVARPNDARHSFGTPSTPNIFGPKPGQYSYPPGISLFSNHSRQPVNRRASFVSIEGDEKARASQSPTARPASQSTNDGEFPPTPTKRNFGHNFGSAQRRSVREAQTVASSDVTPPVRFSSCKLTSTKSSPDSVGEDSDSVMEDSPSACLRLKSTLTDNFSPSSFTKSRLLKKINSPTTVSGKPTIAPFLTISTSGEDTKFISVSPASPCNMRSELASPHTPQDNLVPPDPSGLSISAHNDQPLFYNAGSSSTLPATPTAPREYFTNFGNRPSLVLAGPSAIDVDASLTSRFEKAELVGTGEFSLVYRVTKQPEASPFHPAFSLTASRSSSQASLPERVWAVKKSKYSYSGAKDRQKKIHEVDVLKTLGLSDHIVSFVDSWEERGHLYIQTEFCEEGSMDDFLTRVGMQGRLDDFRIWKILLELSLGLKHIHDHGFIHLDIKPANILITFEGVLKIADFGMAAKWPAKAHIEGEGDREYIGPEILKGQYDKPADIFALGLIMVETAGNVSLPDNGTSWQKLRNGDLSDVPSLTWSSENSNATRDISGNGLDKEPSFEEMRDVSGVDDAQLRESPSSRRSFRGKKSTTHITREGELTEPPTWMIDPNSEHGLERIIRWMISPHPGDRPRVDEVLQTFGVQFADSRRRAGATIFEGNWGPADEVLAEDAEMIDV